MDFNFFLRSVSGLLQLNGENIIRCKFVDVSVWIVCKRLFQLITSTQRTTQNNIHFIKKTIRHSDLLHL